MRAQRREGGGANETRKEGERGGRGSRDRHRERERGGGGGGGRGKDEGCCFNIDTNMWDIIMKNKIITGVLM